MLALNAIKFMALPSDKNNKQFDGSLIFCQTKRDVGKMSPLPFFQNGKKCSDFVKECCDNIHLWTKFFTLNVVLIV